jgi:hypothetical protein
MQRAREGVLWLRGTRGILPNTRAIVQKSVATKRHKSTKMSGVCLCFCG